MQKNHARYAKWVDIQFNLIYLAPFTTKSSPGALQR